MEGRSLVTCANGRFSPTVTGDRMAQKWDGEKRWTWTDACGGKRDGYTFRWLCYREGRLSLAKCWIFPADREEEGER